jgi:exodeoxyribonuclease III
MKITSFNINNVRHRLPNLLKWLRETRPDIVCLQELKATDSEFPVAAIRDAGYEAIWRGQKTWNGVAILSRRRPIQTLSDLPGEPDDKQSRYIEAAVSGIVGPFTRASRCTHSGTTCGIGGSGTRVYGSTIFCSAQLPPTAFTLLV